MDGRRAGSRDRVQGQSGTRGKVRATRARARGRISATVRAALYTLHNDVYRGADATGTIVPKVNI